MIFQTDRTFAEQLDANDPLASYRTQFHIPKSRSGIELIYLCGNSLGLQPVTARAYVEQELKDWEALGVGGHHRAKHPWYPYHELLTAQTATVCGALPSEVVVMNTLTVNLHLMLVSFYRPSKERHRIVIEAHAFPSDRYAVDAQIRFHGFDPALSLVELKPRAGESMIRTEDVETFLEREGKSVALVFLGGVNYYSGQAFEMDRIARAGRAHGCMVGFDLAHAIGNLVLRLHDWEVDFAVWCSYKYLNGGPGAVGGCFVHERHARSSDLPRFAGWWGHNKERRFLMEPAFDPLPGAEGWQLSNPPILSMAALRSSMEIFEKVGMEQLRAKSELLTGYMEYLLRQTGGDSLEAITPTDPAQRGAQLSIRIPGNGRVVHQKLTGQGIVCDWREPDVIRIAPVPLYNSFRDVFAFSGAMKKALQDLARGAGD